MVDNLSTKFKLNDKVLVKLENGATVEGIVEQLVPYIQVCCMDENGTFIKKYSNADAQKCLTILPRKTTVTFSEVEKSVNYSNKSFELTITKRSK